MSEDIVASLIQNNDELRGQLAAKDQEILKLKAAFDQVFSQKNKLAARVAELEKAGSKLKKRKTRKERMEERKSPTKAEDDEFKEDSGWSDEDLSQEAPEEVKFVRKPTLTEAKQQVDIRYEIDVMSRDEEIKSVAVIGAFTQWLPVEMES